MPFALVLALVALLRVHCDQSEIAIGHIGPLRGSLADVGCAVRDGLEVAFAAANAVGGPKGHRLRLLARNDEFNVTLTGRTSTAVMGRG